MCHCQSGNNSHLQNISPGWLRMETDERVEAGTSWPTSVICACLEFLKMTLSVPKSRGKVPFETQDAYDNHLIQLFSRTVDTKTGTPPPRYCETVKP